MNEGERRLLDVIRMNSYIATFADPSKTVLGCEFYTYTIDEVGLTLDGQAAQTFPIIMDSDSDFVITGVCGGAVVTSPVIANPANGNRVVEYSPSIVVQVLNESSGKTWFNNPTPLPMIAGTGGFPFLLVNPRVILARSTLQISAQAAGYNADIAVNAEFSAFFFSLIGAKIYYAG